MSQVYTFRTMKAGDLPMTRNWLAIPEVARWWDDPIAAEDALADPDVTVWIVSHESRPFAYLQEYDPHAWPGHHFSFLPPGSRGIDQFIGDPDMLGRGHGPASSASMWTGCSPPARLRSAPIHTRRISAPSAPTSARALSGAPFRIPSGASPCL